MPRKEKIVVELGPEVVALLKRIADAIAPEHHAPPIGETKRLVESDQRDHEFNWAPLIEKAASRNGAKIPLESESLKLTVAETEQIEVALAPRKKWWDNIEPGVD